VARTEAGTGQQPGPEAELAALLAAHGTAWTIGIEDGRCAARRGRHRPRADPRVRGRARARAADQPWKAAPVTGRRGPFDVDQDRAIDALRMMWGDSYDIGFADGSWHAAPLDGTGRLLTGQVPDELAAAIRADWGVRSAR
jgi:hypothetical protein